MSIRSLCLAAGLILAVAFLASYSVPGQAEGYCGAGHHFDEAKGLCYDPHGAYKPNVPQGASLSGGIADRPAFCQYGDRLVGAGDQAYCLSKASGKPYPAGR